MTRSGTLIIAFSLGWVAPDLAEAQPRNSYQKRARPTLVWALKEIERIEGMASGCVEGKKIRKRLALVRRHLGFLVPGARRDPAPLPTHRAAVRAISSSNFARLMGTVRTQRFSQGKVRAIKQSAARNRFTCRQVAALVRAFSLVDYKLMVLRLMSRRITDRQNAAVIYGAFSNPKDRSAAKSILSRKRRRR